MEIVKVLDWFKSLSKPNNPVTVEVPGESYRVNADGTLGEVVRHVIPVAPVATPVLDLYTLSGLVAAVKADVDSFTEKKRFAIQVEVYNRVALISLAADEWGRRHVCARAKAAEIHPFQFGEYMDPETFLITAQAGFLPSTATS